MPKHRQTSRRSPAPAAAQADSAAAVASVGRVARRLREEQQLTLSDVAGRAGISAPMLSRIETGNASPSLETVIGLAEALGIRPSLLLQDVGSEDDEAQWVPAGAGMEVVRRGTKRGHTYHLLAATRGPRKVLEPFLVTLNDKSEIFPRFQHPGVEFIHVLSGELWYRHGTQSYHLKPGDSLTFSGQVAHGPEQLVKVPIRMLSVLVYPDVG